MTIREQTTYTSLEPGEFFQLATSLAVIAMTICGLAGIAAPTLAAAAAIVLGASLFADGRRLLSMYAQLSPFGGPAASWKDAIGANSPSSVFFAGILGAVLGLLSVSDVNPAILTPAAAIAYGTSFVLKSNATWQLHLLRRVAASKTPAIVSRAHESLLNEHISEIASIQAFAGLASAVLGSLAVAGNSNDLVLTLASLLILASMVVLSADTVSAAIFSLSQTIARGSR